MQNVRWKTAIYILCSTISIVLSIAGVYYGLKSDIKDNRTEGKEEAHAFYYKLRYALDSSNADTRLQIQGITQLIYSLPQSKTIIIHPKQKGAVGGMFEERYIDGKLTFVPVTP